MKKPEDAVISAYSKEEGYKIIPEKEGTTVQTEKFMDVLRRAILKLEDSVSLEEADCYAKPRRTAQSKNQKIPSSLSESGIPEKMTPAI